MHVLYFHQHFSTLQGATGTRSYEFARSLLFHGHKVTVVCGTYDVGNTGLAGPFVNGKRIGNVDGIDVIEFLLPYTNALSFYKRYLIFLKFAVKSIFISMQYDYDLVFASSTPLTAGVPGIFARILRKKPFVFEVRDLWPELPREMGVISNPVILFLMSCLEWLSYHVANSCIGLSPGIVKGIVRRNINPKFVTMIPNGCDLKLFNQVDIQGWRPQGVKESDFMAVFTGAHGLANGLDAVLNAAECLMRKGRYDIKMVFIGEGKLKPELIKYAEKKELVNCIFHNSVSKIRLSGLLKEADLGMMILANIPAFYYGTSPNKFFDYIASGLPVLINYPGWLADMIIENRCGIVVSPDEPATFATAIIKMADARDELKVMGANGRRLGETEFDRNILAKRFVSFLENKVA